MKKFVFLIILIIVFTTPNSVYALFPCTNSVYKCDMNGGLCKEYVKDQTCYASPSTGICSFDCGAWSGFRPTGRSCIPNACGITCSCAGITCSVSCAVGETTINTGPLCATTRSSTCKDSCGEAGACKSSRTCYQTETNISAPSQPTEITLNNTSLSLIPESPTSETMSDATISIPTITTPITSRGVGYYFKIFDSSNKQIYTSQSPTADTNNRVNTSNTITLPSSLTDQMQDGQVYKISGMYYTLDRCNYTVKYSTPIEGYFIANNNPNLTCTEMSCSISDVFNNLGSESSYGCSNSEYIGQEINNPLNVNLELTDEDGNEEIEGVILWFRDTSSQQIKNFGIKIVKNSTWDNLSIYSSLGESWSLVTNELIQNNNNENISRVFNESANETTEVNLYYAIELLPGNTTLQGTYEIFIQGLDIYTVDKTNLNPDQMERIGELGIDLVDPIIEDDIAIDLTDIQNILFSWESEDLESGILSTQVNGYVKTDNSVFQTSPIYLNDTEITNVTAPEGEDSEQIGLMDDPYGINILPPTEQIGLNIGDNEYGDISVYVRVFDNACNSEIRTNSISFAPWTASKGGYFYSKSGSRVEAQDISGQTDLNDELINFDVTTISQGTEILGSRSQYIYQLIHPELKAVSATSIEDSNNQNNYWYKRIKNIADNQNNLSSPNDTCESDYCFYSTENDITLDSNFVCTSNTVFISDGDITISPINKETTTVETDNDTACIFIAKNNIIITNEGHTATTKEIAYDYLEGFFVAENQIIINSGRIDEDKKYGLEIEGGLVAFGNTDNRSIQNNRSLGAMNLISPSLLVNFHPKYSKISEELIGRMVTSYIKEIGLSKK